MQNNKLTLGLFILLMALLVHANDNKFYKWRHCYGQDASPHITVYDADVEYLPAIPNYHTPNTAGITLNLVARISEETNASLFQQVNETFWQFEMYSMDDGSKIQYKGPFDACCGFFTNSTCVDVAGNDSSTITDCPREPGSVFSASVTRPMYKESPGKWEATLIVYKWKQEFGKQIKDELLCVDVQFAAVQKQQAKPQPRGGIIEFVKNLFGAGSNKDEM